MEDPEWFHLTIKQNMLRDCNAAILKEEKEFQNLDDFGEQARRNGFSGHFFSIFSL